MAEHAQLYSRADLYDIALARDVEPEGLEPVAWYGALDLEQPLDATPASTRMIGVFGKR